MFVSLENQPKSLSQLRQLLSEVEQVESQAIEAVTKAIASYKSASLSPEYWEGFASQIFSLFPSEVVRKGQPTGDKFVEALRRENEDLRENLQALEQELAETKSRNSDVELIDASSLDIQGLAELKAERDELKRQLLSQREETIDAIKRGNNFEKQLEIVNPQFLKVKAERDELRAKLAEWESKGNELANNLIESSVGDRQSWEEEKALLIQGFQERANFFQKEIDRYQQLEKDWGVRLAHQAEELKTIVREKFSLTGDVERLTEDRDNLLIRLGEYNERFEKLYEKEVQPAINRADDLDRMLSQCEKKLHDAERTIEVLESSGNRRELEEQILRLTAEVEKLQNGTPIPESDLYVEFIKLSDTAGYLKVRESGEILAAYVGTNNQKNENGRRLVLGKSILKDWQSHFQILHSQSKSEIRKGKRLTTDWEMKITNLPFETIEKLGTYDYTQPPQRPQQKPETKPEIELKRAEPFDALCPEYYVLFNGEEYGRVWRIPGKLPHAWKHNNFGPNDKPFNSPEGAAKALVEIEREADKETEDDSDTPEF